MKIRPATDHDIPVIHRLASEIWWPTYGGFLSSDQISFMLDNMYSIIALKQQLDAGIIFLLVQKDNETIGFASYSLTEYDDTIFKIHKLYLLPSEQGRGTGKKLLEHIASLAKDQGGKLLELNVNRENPAFHFYKKMGFEVYQTVDIPYYQFVLNDFVMRKLL